ncbi:hypothetical protein HJC23_007630 [Cyclotella cryptica]|uniref:Uncharacterized protein n=1 Tax=Cyclotella cryptica TaxID=29204 RepID=A0ABD3QR83_9STRA|eukprot:CCRYP_002940-RA/>CCRYP_002940-RA protein AED:0.00 eAED:0.00 QI:326/-1/1/1/-1/1/1/313/522
MGKSSRLRAALCRVFKVRGSRQQANPKHVVLVESDDDDVATPAADDTTNSGAIPANSISNTDSCIQRSNKPIDLDEETYTSEKIGTSEKGEQAPITIEYIRQESGNASWSVQTFSAASSNEIGDLQNEPDTSQVFNQDVASHCNQLHGPTPKNPLWRSRSVPNGHNYNGKFVSSCTVDDIPATNSLEEKHSSSSPRRKMALFKNSPTGVTDLFPLEGRGTPPCMDAPLSAREGIADSSKGAMHECRNSWKSRSRSSSGEAATSHPKYIIPRHNHDNQKTNEAFLALKKELEKNEFTKAAQVIKHARSSEGSIVTTGPSQESEQQQDDRFEIIPNSPQVDSQPASRTPGGADDILGIVAVSQSESADSQCSDGDGSSFSSFDMDSIGEITIDSTTLKLIEMHKIYCDDAKTNGHHPARMKKSSMRATSAYPVELDDASIKTEENRKVTWYDDDVNLNKPFTLRTDESFDVVSTGPTKQIFHGFERSMQMVDQYLIPFAKQGLEKLLGKIQCGTNDDDLSWNKE